jgi:hypothetical protein
MVFDDFLRDTRLNMALAWSITAFLVVVFFESLLSLDVLWIVFTAFLLFLIALPSIVYRSSYAMLPWELLLVAAVPVFVRALNLSVFSSRIATFVSLAALALLIAVELHVFTSVKFNHGFAVVFVMVSTLAIEGVWSLTRYYMDFFVGTAFLSTNQALMFEWGQVAVAGLFAGLLFDFYFQRRDKFLRKGILKVVKK